MNIIRRIYDWMGSKVGSPWANAWLLLLFFIESSVFIIPVDPLLILYCVKHQKRSFYYATLATIASVLGGLFGYAIGAVMWHTVGTWIVQNLISQHVFDGVAAKYAIYQHWAVLIAALTPVPYKAVTISAGFCHLSLPSFILFSILGRGLRFYLLAGLIYKWGERIQAFIDRYFNLLAVAFIFILLLSVKVLF
jgi:membrane protein YqaA with SNARE-associated domain